MLASILIGLVLTVVTVGIHATTSAWWIGRLKGSRMPSSGLGRRLLPAKLLCTTALVLLASHFLEVMSWASVYLILPGVDSLHTFEEATYFATVTFASLGYGDIVISGPWRLLSAIQAMNGLLVFGWSTALLFAVVERIWGGDEQPKQQPRRRRPLRVITHSGMVKNMRVSPEPVLADSATSAAG